MKNIKALALNLICLALIGLGTFMAWQYQTTTTPYGETDYGTFYQVLRNNQNIYQTNNFVRVLTETTVNGKPQLTTTNPTQSVNLNTPLMSLFLKELVNISDKLSVNTAIWVGFSLLGAGIGIWILLISINADTTQIFIPVLLIFLLNNYSLDTLTAGQISFFIFPIASLAYFFCYTKHINALAITLGLLSAMKLFFLIFLVYFLAKKAWQSLLLMTLSFLIFFCLPLLYFGSNTYFHFFSLPHDYFVFIARSAMSRNGSLLGFISNLSYFLDSTITALQLRYIAYAAVSYFVIRSVIYDFYVLQKLPAYSDEIRFSFYTIIALFCSPLTWIYYFVFLTIPMFVFYKVSQRYQLGSLFYLCLFFGLTLTAISNTPIDLAKTHLLFFIRQISAFTALLCWLFALIVCTSYIKQHRYRANKKNYSVLIIYFIASLFSIGYMQITNNKLYFIFWNQTQFLKEAKPIKEVQIRKT